MTDAPNVVPMLSEAQRAEILKARAGDIVRELCLLMDEGMQQGLLVRWANIGLNAWGKHDPVDLHIEKRF